MVFKMKKQNIIALICPLLLFSNGCSSPEENDPDISTTIQETTYCLVSFPSKQEGYMVVGGKSVVKGKDYYFTISINEGYNGDNMVVKANGSVLSSSSFTYVVRNVESDLNITIEGISKNPYLKLAHSSYKFYLGHIGKEVKTNEYFLSGVEGFFDNAPCRVNVDISNVDFTKVGTYEIFYSLLGHEEINKRIKVVILDNPSNINDVNIDIASIYENEIVSKKSFGEINVDFSLRYGDYILTDNDVFSSEKYDGNFLSREFLKTLGLGSFSFKIIFSEELSLDFNVNVVDALGPNFYYQVEDKEICFTKGSLILPDIELSEDSIQTINVSYSLNSIGKEKEEILNEINDNEGDYSYTLAIQYNGKVVEEKDYTIHIRDAYIPFSFYSDGNRFASKYYYKNGNPVLGFDYSGDTNVGLDESFIKTNNVNNKKYVFIAFRVISSSSNNATIWNRDPEICFDANGNYVPTDANPKYNGGDIGKVGSLMFRIFPLNGNKFENDVWIMRGFSGNIEILKTEFCDLNYVDPMVEKEATKDKLNSLNSSFSTLWNYFHVAATGKSGGNAMGGDSFDIQPTLPADMEKAGYNGVALKIKIKDRSDIKAAECWIYDEDHYSSYDGFADENGLISIDLPLEAFHKAKTQGHHVMYYFSTSLTPASSYAELRTNSNKNYVSSSDFVFSSVEFY